MASPSKKGNLVCKVPCKARSVRPPIDFQQTLDSFTYDPTLFGDRFKDENTKDMIITIKEGDSRNVSIHKALLKATSPHWMAFFNLSPSFKVLLMPRYKIEDVEDVVKILYEGRPALLRVPEERRFSVIETAIGLKLKLFVDFEEV